MPDEIQKSEHPDSEEVAAAILSFNDPSIITNLFKQLGWSYTLEIQETVSLAKQNANLSIKFKAIKHLRELLREAAETAGLVADVSHTTRNPEGGTTTFHGKRIAGMLSPAKKIESTIIKESENDRIKEQPNAEPDRGGDRREGERPERSREVQTGIRNGTDTNAVFPSENIGAVQTGNPKHADSTGLGSPEQGDGGTPPERRQSGGTESADEGETAGIRNGETDNGRSVAEESTKADNPCIKTRGPTCDHDLYPGISSAED